MPATPTPTIELELQDRRHTSLSLARTQRTISNALSIACPQCAASQGVYCTPSANGFCRYRWEKASGMSVPAQPPITSKGLPTPAQSLPGSKTEPDRRHPNRHPVRSAR